ncbi:hypothetical protein PLICRDRAFT_52328 [Plicaturopsis crispa FD-325 SS-3]|nr:hypothetical protein PLICRDRAFT_52328 [Plicaturopsis crispa FD-325 SS-3]
MEQWLSLSPSSARILKYKIDRTQTAKDCEKLDAFNETPSYDDTVAVVYETARIIPEFRKSSHVRLRSFSEDVALVALSVRSAYLVDAIAVSSRALTALVVKLRQSEKGIFSSRFKQLIQVHDLESEQSFLANAPMLMAISDSLQYQSIVQGEPSVPSDNSLWTRFVVLDVEPHLIQRPPHALFSAVQGVCENWRASQMPSYALPSGLDQQTLVPLAGVLLGYPVAYVPVSASQTAFLPGALLDVYECILVHLQGRRHTLLKFSCPSSVALENPSLAPAALVASITHVFKSRLADLNAGIDLKVLHHTAAFDRVAL